MEFCAKVDPENEKVISKLNEVRKLREEGYWCSPTKISDEKNYNVFMRSTFDKKMLEITGKNDVIDCMRFLREWKNAGNKPAL